MDQNLFYFFRLWERFYPTVNERGKSFDEKRAQISLVHLLMSRGNDALRKEILMIPLVSTSIWILFCCILVFYSAQWGKILPGVALEILKSVQVMVRMHIFTRNENIRKICKRTITWTLGYLEKFTFLANLTNVYFRFNIHACNTLACNTQSVSSCVPT